MKVMDAMVDWVEKGITPETLPAVGENKYGVRLERDICMYPRVQHYVGGGMTKQSTVKFVQDRTVGKMYAPRWEYPV